jgi:WD40 repeat protein
MARPPAALDIPNIERVADSCISADGTLLAFLYFDGSVRVLGPDSQNAERRNFTRIAETAPCCRRATSIAIVSSSTFGDLFVVGDEQGHTFLYQRVKIDEFGLMMTFSQHSGPINSVAFAPFALAFACASSDGFVSVTVCDMKNWFVFPIRVSSTPVTSLSWSPPVWMSFIEVDPGAVPAAAPPEGDAVKLVVGAADGCFTIFHQKSNGALAPDRPAIQAHAGAVNAVAWRPLAGFARTEIATCGADRLLKIWTIENDEVDCRVVSEFQEESVDIKWSACGFVMSVSSGAATVTLWREADEGRWALMDAE